MIISSQRPEHAVAVVTMKRTANNNIAPQKAVTTIIAQQVSVHAARYAENMAAHNGPKFNMRRDRHSENAHIPIALHRLDIVATA
eukprot:6174282-Pleurochrysis_carterae.AAC.2